MTPPIPVRRTLGLSILLLMAGVAAVATAFAGDRPNIVFVMADDLGWADVAFHGGTAPTPHLDQLARHGLELTQHFVAPVCSPTRTGFLTGRCWSRFGITTPINERGLPWDTVTLPRALETRGYNTCLIGKWHLGSKPDWGPNRFGFQHAYGSLAGGVSPWNHRYKKGPYTVTWHRNGELLEETGHVTDLLADEAVRWIRARGDAPFFLYIPFTAVHLPLKEPESWLAKVPDPISGAVPRHYAASVMHLDDAVGRIVGALKEEGHWNRTLFVFTSDNGGSNAENNDLKYPDDNCPNGRLPGNNRPFRGGKGSVYEGGTRVPTIVSWPGSIRSGTEPTPVFISDWMPTFCAMAGYPPPDDLRWDGVDLSNVLLHGADLPGRSIYLAGPSWRSKSLRFGDWKLVVHGQEPNATLELFHLAKDPSEKSNLAKREPGRVKELLDRLEAASKTDRDAMIQD